MSKDGGSYGGTIRFKEELTHGGNAGLAVTAVPWLEPIHKKYQKAGLSYADLYTLAGGECCRSLSEGYLATCAFLLSLTPTVFPNLLSLLLLLYHSRCHQGSQRSHHWLEKWSCGCS